MPTLSTGATVALGAMAGISAALLGGQTAPTAAPPPAAVPAATQPPGMILGLPQNTFFIVAGAAVAGIIGIVLLSQ